MEGREVPAGALTASVSAAGVLSIVGDDLDNTVTIKVTGTNVVLTPDATTAINGNPVNTPVTLTDVATSMKADFKSGDDSFTIDPTSDFILTGPASIKLGDGNNELNLITTLKLELGGLAVSGGDGDDTVNTSAGVGLGKVSGVAKVELGLGNGSLDILETKFTGPAGLKVSGDLINVTGTNATVDKTLAVAGGSQTAAIVLSGGSLGGLVASGKFAVLADLTNTPVNGKVSVKSGFQSALQVSNATITGSVDVSGSFTVIVSLDTAPVTGNVKTKSGFQSQVLLDDSVVTGDLNVVGTFAATLDTDGVSAVRNATLVGTIQSQLLAGGTSFTVNGNFSLKGGLATGVNFATTALSEVKGNLSVKGGSLQNVFTANQFLKASKDVTMNMGDGSNSINIGNGAATVPILGNLNITTGKGSTLLTLANVAVTKATKIKLGAGSDTLTIDKGSVFTGAFSADMGAGDDLVSIAQGIGSLAEVKFNGKATILTGAGNDTLLLGKGTGGDAFSKVQFNGAGSLIDGGANINTFDDGALMSFTGLVLGTSILNFTDPNP